MQITGKLLLCTPIEQIKDTFKKCNIIIQTDSETQYPQEVSIEVHNDNIDKLKGLAKGDNVTVDINLRGRRYSKEGKPDTWFNTLVFWKVAVNSKGTPEPVTAEAVEDDLPF